MPMIGYRALIPYRNPYIVKSSARPEQYITILLMIIITYLITLKNSIRSGIEIPVYTPVPVVYRIPEINSG